MLEKIIELDKELFIFLNSLGSSTFDGLWLFITKQFNWTPFFLFVFYFLQRKLGWKNFGIALVFIAVLILICDQTANFFKATVERFRPCNDPEIKDIIRVVKHSFTYSFFSGHATNSMATTTFVFLILKKYYKYTFLLFIFPLIFAYSRIYLGLHFPIDIITGYVFGGTFGYLAYKLYQKKVLN
jgi:undecaprenyl-diphosphatase